MSLKEASNNEISELRNLLNDLNYNVNDRYSHVTHLLSDSFKKSLAKEMRRLESEAARRTTSFYNDFWGGE